ncbi:TraK domain-containing protein [Geoalkalibacter halelectricus]|uniref:TraK domain-containing protein n=1 Tax=Geoalkalibacter halelectricus TaxID=2847045 RepID=UPI003D216872
MKKIVAFLTLAALVPVPCSFAWADRSFDNPVLLPEITNTVILSATDVNRIACPEPIEDIIFSAEKQVEGRFVGKDAFVKFKPIQRGTEVVYAESPVEFFVVCAGAVYTLIAKPSTDFSAVTVRLSSPKRDTVRENVSRFDAMPLDKMATQLIQEAYRGQLSPSYTIQPVHRMIDLSGELLVVEKRVVSVEGVGLELSELSVRSVTAPASTLQSSTEPIGAQIRLLETDFVKPAVGESILAIAIADQVLAPGQETRVFIVRHRGRN